MRAEKQFLLDEIKEKIDGSNGFIIAGYQKFPAGRARDFRDQLAKANGEFEVVRKRIFAKAAQASGISINVDSMEGHLGIVFAYEDATQVTKLAVKYGEDNEGSVTVLGGHIDGDVCTAEDLQAIAKLPDLDTLRAQFVGLIAAPMQQTVGALNAVLTGVIRCLDEKAKKDS